MATRPTKSPTRKNAVETTTTFAERSGCGDAAKPANDRDRHPLPVMCVARPRCRLSARDSHHLIARKRAADGPGGLKRGSHCSSSNVVNISCTPRGGQSPPFAAVGAKMKPGVTTEFETREFAEINRQQFAGITAKIINHYPGPFTVLDVTIKPGFGAPLLRLR